MTGLRSVSSLAYLLLIAGLRRRTNAGLDGRLRRLGPRYIAHVGPLHYGGVLDDLDWRYITGLTLHVGPLRHVCIEGDTECARVRRAALHVGPCGNILIVRYGYVAEVGRERAAR